MNPLVMELLMDLGTEECVAAIQRPAMDVRDISGDYEGMAFDQERDNYLRFIGQVGQ